MKPVFLVSKPGLSFWFQSQVFSTFHCTTSEEQKLIISSCPEFAEILVLWPLFFSSMPWCYSERKAALSSGHRMWLSRSMSVDTLISIPPPGPVQEAVSHPFFDLHHASFTEEETRPKEKHHFLSFWAKADPLNCCIPHIFQHVSPPSASTPNLWNV